MPNIGKHSTGCFSCRRMKVRCDETKPSCLRCAKGRRPCPGYPDGFVSVQPGLEKKKTRRITKSTSRGITLSSSKDHPGHTDIVHYSWLTNLSGTPEEWYNRSIKFFFYTHTCARGQASGGFSYHLDLFEAYCSRSTCSTYLTDALKSASLANMAHRVPHLKWLAIRAVFHHCRALEGVRIALRDDVSARSDDLLMTLWCLEKLEIIEGDKDVVKNHSAGISAVIKLRGVSTSTSELGAQLFNAMNIHLATQDFVFGTNYHLHMKTGYPLQYILNSKVAQLVRTYRAFLSGRTHLSEKAILQQAETLDAEIQPLIHGLPPVLRSEKRLIGTTEIMVDFFQKIPDVFPRLNYHTMRIRTLRIAAECSRDPGVLSEKISAQVLATASLISALLGEAIEGETDPLLAEGCCAGSHVATFALGTLFNTPEFVNEDIRKWVLEQYTYIGQAYGVKQAFTFREYFASGTALTDGQRLMAMERRTFPKSAPAFIVGHENPLANLTEKHQLGETTRVRGLHA